MLVCVNKWLCVRVNTVTVLFPVLCAVILIACLGVRVKGMLQTGENKQHKHQRYRCSAEVSTELEIVCLLKKLMVCVFLLKTFLGGEEGVQLHLCSFMIKSTNFNCFIDSFRAFTQTIFKAWLIFCFMLLIGS